MCTKVIDQVSLVGDLIRGTRHETEAANCLDQGPMQVTEKRAATGECQGNSAQNSHEPIPLAT